MLWSNLTLAIVTVVFVLLYGNTPSVIVNAQTLTFDDAQVVIRLTSTSGPLTETATTTFLTVCTEFYNEYLSNAAMNVTCEIPTRRLEDEEVQPSIHDVRALQTQDVAPLDVTVNVMAVFDETAGVIAFVDALIESVNANSYVFATQLRTRGDAVSQVYFQSVIEVAAYDPASVPAVVVPTSAPTSSFREAEAQVVIRLSSTPGPLTESATTTFIDVCLDFYNEYLPSAFVAVAIDIPTRRLRDLQTQDVTPFDVTINVIVVFDRMTDVNTFANALMGITNTNSDVFVTQLRTTGNAFSQAYFQSVTKLEAFDPESVPPVPTPVPTTAPVLTTAPVSATIPSNGLSNQIIWIVIAVVGALWF